MKINKIVDTVKETVTTRMELFNDLNTETKVGMGINILGGFPIGCGIGHLIIGKPVNAIIDFGIGTAMTISGNYLMDRGFKKDIGEFIKESIQVTKE